MRPIEQDGSLFYYEEKTGYMYEDKKFNNVHYFIPLDFCTLDCKFKDKQKNTTDYVSNINIEAIQKHVRRVQLRGQQKPGANGNRLQPRNSVRNRAPRWFKVQHNKPLYGISAVHKRSIRSNCSYNLFGASSTAHVHGIRLEARTKNFR